MTLYAYSNPTDSWPPNEVHVSRITESSYGCTLKLKSGRLAVLVLPYKPSADDEPAIIRRLIWQDRKDRFLRFLRLKPR